MYGKILLIILFSGLYSCTKFVQIDPPTNKLINANVFTDDGSATAAMSGIYTRMMSSQGFAGGGLSSVTYLSGLSADELINYSPQNDYIQFYGNSLTPTNGYLNSSIWSEAYQYIYSANAVLEGLNGSSGLSAPVKQQLLGEAKFIRAFCYFYLTSLFGDVPLYLSSDYQKNQTAAKTATADVYSQIVSDIREAHDLLSDDYSFSNGERIRPNKSVANALLSRIYLYQQKWDSAETQASSVINNSTVYSLVGLDSVFLANSNEAIWQLMPVTPGNNTNEGAIFILKAPPTYVSLSSFITDAFETGDNRLTHWVGTYTNGLNTWYYPFKYKVQTGTTLKEYSMVLRLGEQYLIRAEARANQNNLLGAESDLNIIRHRAGLVDTAINDQAAMLLAIEHERQVELFTEWGHRWLDLIRTNRTDIVLGLEKIGWQPFDKLYPIPGVEIQRNPKITQNMGY